MEKELACSTTDLSVAYRDEAVVRNVNFAVPQGVVMGIIGPNGAGKSTLIKAMLGLVRPLTGSSAFFGQPLDKVRLRVGYMAQSNSVDWDFPTTVRDVVLMGTYGRLGWAKRPGNAEREIAERAMTQTGITDLASRQIGELSGGQRQRVFLARTLAGSPDLYFMDEPFQGIDATSQAAIAAVMHQETKAGKTIVIVHHDLATVRDYCDHVTLLNRKIVASGPAEEVFTADNIRVTYEVANQSAAKILESL